MSTIKNYLSLVKFAHTIFALPFAMIGFTLGAVVVYQQGSFTGKEILIKLLLVLVCMVTARSAAMAFNRYLDRHFDARNPRTAIREIPKGIISAGSALRFTVVNCLLFMAATAFINPICLILSPVALFVILFYSYTKRFTSLCHLVLGLGLSLAPIGAYLALTGVFSLLPILFSLAVITWVSGFDIIYAMQDIDFDKSQSLHSIPTAMGGARALKTSELLHVLSSAFVVVAGIYGHFSWLYWIGIGVFIGMLVYQHLLVKPNDLSRVNIAFMTANGIASVVFGCLVIADIIFI
ncbi:UbiA-like polyprenyltransferase [Arachidicoccus terrestris]|uniref:UbiA-like polyprenyltransferase n=1 Tax=Arachidicoccus terrestris TaxID=2875539 RepID=UPI001CC3CAEC|nr:UbiA-like polyprenyltransferase [Arachidicoccus terrestris]UAY55228.1 putative 4-hydroxybenzoate polyprenyltransferase [Arachidicoccus terrestris]